MLEDYKEKFEKELTYLKEELSRIRTGRATVSLLDNIIVEAYEEKTPLPQLATITIPEPRSIIIQPWDKTIIKEVEKALANSDLGLSVKNEGNFLRAVLPLLTEENREKLVKVLKEKVEKSRIAMRLIRDNAKERIIDMENNKEITEDEKYKNIENLDIQIKEYNRKIEEIAEAKEKKIMTI
ncbi:MAG: ribosome recycling factor [Xanthomonadaceae bacterium]|nr:ribosome recycling factor [Rhodospirillaceae bacterium]NIA17803.1 ribosome recycling factor [Xanthomonadaceae bacterium]